MAVIMKKKIVHVVLNLDIGGLEKVLVNCINRLPQSQYQHEVVALKGYSEEFKALLPSSVNVFSLNKKDGNDWSIFASFYKYLRCNKPDILHTYNLSTLELQLVAFMCRVPLRVHAEHGRDIFDPTGSNRKYKLLRRLLFPLIHKVVAVSDDLFQWLKHDVGVKKHKLLLIANGIDTEYFKPIKETEKAQCFVFGHVGRLAKIKNQKLLIDAFLHASKIDSNFVHNAKLVIVGEGECRGELEEHIKEVNLSESVFLVGAKINMLDEYRRFDAFVMSSLAEGIPMTLLEAMSCELIPVVTSVGGIPEVVNSENGYLYDSGDDQKLAQIMVQLVNKRSLASMKGKQARKRIIDRYSEVAMVEGYSTLYQGAKTKLCVE